MLRNIQVNSSDNFDDTNFTEVGPAYRRTALCRITRPRIPFKLKLN